MDMADGKTESLTAADWTQAALDALARGGLTAVAVEPLAKELGATKGSFYWHFADRTPSSGDPRAVGDPRHRRGDRGLDETQDAETRLRDLLRLAFTSVLDGSAGGAGTVELALQANAAHPLVAATLNRVTERRLSYLTRLYTELGLSPARARDRGLLAYTSFLGHAQLAHATPSCCRRSGVRRPRQPGRRGSRTRR